MEIWREIDGKWAKEPFGAQFGKAKVAIQNFFASGFPSLHTLVLEELKKDDGHRYIVFSQNEAAEIRFRGKPFLGPEEGVGVGHSSFLNAVLDTASPRWPRPISAAYVREDFPNKPLTEEGAKIRFAIEIF